MPRGNSTERSSVTPSRRPRPGGAVGVKEASASLGELPKPSMRSPKKATEPAICTGGLSDWKGGNLLDKTGCRHAEAGDFDRAVEWQEKAISTRSPSRAMLALSARTPKSYSGCGNGCAQSIEADVPIPW
jgi:hypothetical protein